MFLALVIFCVFSTISNVPGLEITDEPQSSDNSSVSTIADEDLFPNIFESPDDYVIVTLPPNTTSLLDKSEEKPHISFADTKQIGFPSDREGPRRPCRCTNGLCACCTGVLMDAFKTKGCMNLRYIPEDFAFQFEMKMNERVLYKNRISGKNPPPICINPPRIGFIEVCANFYDVYFVGRNMHVCLEMGGYFQGFELFSRSFDCIRMGDKGVKVMKPEDEDFRPTSGSLDAEVDAGDDIEDYDENVVRRFDKN